MNQMILLFLLYLNFMMHCVYSNEIEEPQLDHIITSNLTGSERKVYKIKSTCFNTCTLLFYIVSDTPGPKGSPVTIHIASNIDHPIKNITE